MDGPDIWRAAAERRKTKMQIRQWYTECCGLKSGSWQVHPTKNKTQSKHDICVMEGMWQSARGGGKANATIMPARPLLETPLISFGNLFNIGWA